MKTEFLKALTKAICGSTPIVGNSLSTSFIEHKLQIDCTYYGQQYLIMATAKPFKSLDTYFTSTSDMKAAVKKINNPEIKISAKDYSKEICNFIKDCYCYSQMSPKEIEYISGINHRCIQRYVKFAKLSKLRKTLISKFMSNQTNTMKSYHRFPSVTDTAFDAVGDIDHLWDRYAEFYAMYNESKGKKKKKKSKK